MSKTVVEVEELSRRFGRQQALDEVSLTLDPGRVYGLVGANGAGKTTLIKHLLGLLRAQSGSVRVFGHDPVRNPVEVLQRIGYLSEERDLPEWMQVGELMRYTQAYYPRWDEDYERELLDTFHLNPAKQVKHLSKGMRAQAGLIAAVAHRPDLLLLDEPSTGLDAVVRRDILNAIVRTVAEDGRTVLFSSHLLDEVQQMSDEVVMICEGRVVLDGELDDLLEQHLRAHVRNVPTVELPPWILQATRHGDTCELCIQGDTERLQAFLLTHGGTILNARPATLQEIFVARAGRRTQASEDAPVNELC